MFELKPLSPEALPAALEKARHYRLLNEPTQAESICRDILRVEDGHQEALVTLLLALTDQFTRRMGEKVSQALEVLGRITDEYRRAYYGGIVHERLANAHLHLERPGCGDLAYHEYRQAIEAYDRAVELRPAGNDEAILRFNTCARVLNTNSTVKPAREDHFQPLLE